MADVVDPGDARPEALAVVGNAAHGHAAEVHAVIAALAADQPEALAFAPGALVGDGDLERGVDRFGAGVGEEHARQARRRDAREPVGELECDRMPHLEGRRKVHRRHLAPDGFHDLRPGVTGVHAPQARASVEDLATFGGPVIHALGTGKQARRLLELPVGGIRHPEGRLLEPGQVHRIGFSAFIHGVKLTPSLPCRKCLNALGRVGDDLLALFAQALYAQRHHVAGLEEYRGRLDTGTPPGVGLGGKRLPWWPASWFGSVWLVCLAGAAGGGRAGAGYGTGCGSDYGAAWA